MRPADTHPDAHRVQTELLRKATPAQRYALCESLSRMTAQLSWCAIAQANPSLSENAINVRFIRLHHGAELADKLEAYLKERGLW